MTGHRRPALAVVLPLAVALAACGTPGVVLKASAPFAYASAVGPSLERVAILVTITNNSQDDLAVDPTEFVARDAGNRIYPANAAATAADAGSVRVAAGQLGMSGVLALPVMTLRQHDVLRGFVVFDVPQGVRPVALIFRQPDTDDVVSLPAR
ncbi:MAG: DUF4352 domain-containing protein [Chloroflexota bacterium]|nr:DUF4352 domain-containing protein [Chloroflexota bacterium]